jgi:CRISPR/Cas system endoribonuclease Cas6 (RAMP superfamily)
MRSVNPFSLPSSLCSPPTLFDVSDEHFLPSRLVIRATPRWLPSSTSALEASSVSRSAEPNATSPPTSTSFKPSSSTCLPLKFARRVRSPRKMRSLRFGFLPRLPSLLDRSRSHMNDEN